MRRRLYRLEGGIEIQLIGYPVLCGACLQGFVDQFRGIVSGSSALFNHTMRGLDSTFMGEVTIRVSKSLMSTSGYISFKKFHIPVLSEKLPGEKPTLASSRQTPKSPVVVRNHRLTC